MSNTNASSIDSEAVQEALRAVELCCRRYQIGALQDFLESSRSFAGESLLNIAVLGRFKAGKSTFLNHILEQALLPVGVIPVTSVVTEIQYGPHERAEIHFRDGHRESVALERICEFISEEQNPENAKQVALVRVELPSMARFPGLRFVDTPGLESVLEHNTDASLGWLPNVGLALVAVGVDPPLSRHDVELIRSLSRYTPNISVLLTKVDVLDDGERLQVQDFVQQQLARYWNGSVPIFPYSVRPGFEDLRVQIQERLLSRVSAEAKEHRAVVLRHKMHALLAECSEYLNVALKAAELGDAERAELREKVPGPNASFEDTRLALRLVARHAAGECRSRFEKALSADERPVRQRVLASLDLEFPSWTTSLSFAMERFKTWLNSQMTSEMSGLSEKHTEEFVEPVRRVSRQLSQCLQDFRNRISERMLETLGVPLRTTEIELAPRSPRAPDVRVGKIFDHNWELLSLVVPMPLVRRPLRRHFERKVGDIVFVNLSRLATQCEEIASGALGELEKEAIRRLDSLAGTIERMITSAAQEALQIRDDLRRLAALRMHLRGDPEERQPGLP